MGNALWYRLCCEKNANVYSVSKGKVKRAGYFGKYGNYIEIEHTNGFTTRYGHLSKICKERTDCKFPTEDWVNG